MTDCRTLLTNLRYNLRKFMIDFYFFTSKQKLVYIYSFFCQANSGCRYTAQRPASTYSSL